MSTRHRYLVTVVLLAAFAISPLLAPGYFMKAHDAPHSLFFLVEFDRAIRDGALVPRWGADQALGYGYPTFVYYSPLAYYIAESIHLMGPSITTAVKLTYALAVALSGIGMFLLGEAIAGPVAASLAAAVYMYAPYRFVDMYVRSALAESVALSAFPWVLWAFSRLVAKPNRRRMAAASSTYAALLLAHNVTGLLFTPLLVAFVLFSLWRRGRLRQVRSWAYALAAGVLAFATAACSLLPMVFERSYIEQEQWTRATYSLSEHFVYLGQIFSPFWGYGYAVSGADDGMAMQVGLVPLCLGAAGVLLAWHTGKLKWPAIFFGVAMAMYVFLMLPHSEFLWLHIPLANLAQFPWRLLGIVVFCASALAAIAGSVAMDSLGAKGPLPLALLIVVAASLPYAHPEHTPPSARAESPVAAIDFERQYPDMVGITAWAEEVPTDSPKLAAYLAGTTVPLAHSGVPGARLEVLHHGGHVQSVRAVMPEEGQVRFYTYYFPGWKAYVDEQPVPLWPSGSLGLITLTVPQGEHVVTIRFEDTPLRAGAKWITLLTVILLAACLVWPDRYAWRRSP